MPLKGSHMGTETTGRKTPQRMRLSDITNIAAPVSSSKHREENHVPKQSETQLHKELANLKKVLAEKEEIIKAQKVNMEKLWTNYTLKTKQNEDIIQQNARLYKDLMQARDRLKILQHENVQMAVAHKVQKSELQAKLAKALEQADFSQTAAGSVLSEKDPCDNQATIPNVLTKLAESRARRTVSTCEASSEPSDSVKDESLEHPASCRSTLRRRASLSYKEPSLKVKLRQPENTTPSQVKPCISRWESRGHQLHKVREEDPSNACVTTQCNLESQAIESLLPPFSQSTSQATCNASSASSPDVSEEQTPLSRAVSEESLNAPSATHLESGEHPSMQTIDSALFREDMPSGRPSRRSVSCINSYKEAPLNTKMRRPS
eukprot:c18075_g1_i1 orf=41-1171(-)